MVAESEERRLKLEALRTAIQEGIDSGPAAVVDDIEKWIEDIKTRGRERLKASRG